MNTELYRKLVDMYAERELPAELEDQMDLVAETDVELKRDMHSLRNTVDALKAIPSEFTEESYQRILIKLYAHAGAIDTQAPTPKHFQYQLPIQG